MEKPILFNSQMVRAILDGRKTQTRRVVKNSDNTLFSPYGNSGDTLWVRETWGTGTRPCPYNGWRDGIEYRADEAYLEGHDILTLYPVSPPEGIELCDIRSGWRPSIFMPKWASRITLKIISVKIERVQEISGYDVLCEGINTHNENYFESFQRDAFQKLWDSINKKRGYGWETNPWVWKIEFKRIGP